MVSLSGACAAHSGCPPTPRPRPVSLTRFRDLFVICLVFLLAKQGGKSERWHLVPSPVAHLKFLWEEVGRRRNVGKQDPSFGLVRTGLALCGSRVAPPVITAAFPSVP